MTQEKKTLVKTDLLSLDIDGMVQNINNSKGTIDVGGTVLEKHIKRKKHTEVANELPIPLQEDNSMWNAFIDNCKGYEYRVKKAGRKSYWIDEDIVNTLKSCDINKTAVADMINAILRGFINVNKNNLRKFIEKKDILI